MDLFRRVAVSICLASLSFAQPTKVAPAAPAPKARRCPDTLIRTVDNKSIKVSQYHGKVVMIALFLTSCEDCLETLRMLQKFQNDYASLPFQVVAISVDESSANAFQYQLRYRFTFPVGHLDQAHAVQLSGREHVKVPYLMFVDWMGNVRFEYNGDDRIWQDADKNLRGIARGLIRQAQNKEGPSYQTRPAATPTAAAK